MVVFIENPETVEKLMNLSRVKLQRDIKSSVEMYLTQEFKNVSVSPTALAIIEAAEQLGLVELAEQLKSSLNQSTQKLNN
jgi:hypothetical protein